MCRVTFVVLMGIAMSFIACNDHNSVANRAEKVTAIGESYHKDYKLDLEDPIDVDTFTRDVCKCLSYIDLRAFQRKYKVEYAVLKNFKAIEKGKEPKQWVKTYQDEIDLFANFQYFLAIVLDWEIEAISEPPLSVALKKKCKREYKAMLKGSENIYEVTYNLPDKYFE